MAIFLALFNHEFLLWKKEEKKYIRVFSLEVKVWKLLYLAKSRSTVLNHTTRQNELGLHSFIYLYIYQFHCPIQEKKGIMIFVFQFLELFFVLRKQAEPGNIIDDWNKYSCFTGAEGHSRTVVEIHSSMVGLQQIIDQVLLIYFISVIERERQRERKG